MNTAITPNEKTFAQQQSAPKTANNAAALLYPKLSDNFTAFVERRVGIGNFPHIEVLGLCDDFWAHTLGYLGTQTNPCVFVPLENQFRRYNSSTGIYEPVRDSL